MEHACQLFADEQSSFGVAARVAWRGECVEQGGRLAFAWILGGNTGGVIYICGDEEGQRRVERSANRVAPFGRKLRLELLDTIKEQTVAAYEASRSGRAAGASAAPAPMLGGHGG